MITKRGHTIKIVDLDNSNAAMVVGMPAGQINFKVFLTEKERKNLIKLLKGVENDRRSRPCVDKA